MDSFGKGNGQSSAFRPDANNRVAKPLPPRPSSTPPPLNRPLTVPHTPLKTSQAVGAGPPSVPASPVAHAGPRPSDDAYGIRRAIELLRRLPTGERAVLVEVVRMTLESVNIEVGAIIDDADNRGAEIDRRIAVLRTAVKEREEEISTRREEIANLEVEQKEIARVKQELNAAHEQAEATKTSNAPADHDAGAAVDDPGEVTTVIATS